MIARSFLPYFFALLPVSAFCQDMHRATPVHGDWHPHDDHAMNEPSALSVYSENGEPFVLFLNGVRQNQDPLPKVRVEGLPQYDNDIQVVFNDGRTPPINRHINIADPIDGRAVNMVLKIVRDRDGRAQIRFSKCLEFDRNYHGQQDEYVMNYGDYHHAQPNTNYPPPAPPPPPAPMAMDPRSFNDAKQAIASASFDDTKLSTAKSIVNANYLNVNEVIEICNLFTFDENKLSFAKMAYDRTVDNGSYFRVGEVFSFDSFKQSLNDFIASHQH